MKNKGKMKIDLINSWKKGNKQDDKIGVELRFGRLSIVDIKIDFSQCSFRAILLNFGFELKK